jgi:hypothetical protein
MFAAGIILHGLRAGFVVPGTSAGYRSLGFCNVQLRTLDMPYLSAALWLP